MFQRIKNNADLCQMTNILTYFLSLFNFFKLFVRFLEKMLYLCARLLNNVNRQKSIHIECTYAKFCLEFVCGIL